MAKVNLTSMWKPPTILLQDFLAGVYMFFLSLVQFIVIALLLAFAITQMVVPLLKGTPMFPMFRKRRAELESKVSDLRGELEEEELAREVSKLEKKLGKSDK